VHNPVDNTVHNPVDNTVHNPVDYPAHDTVATGAALIPALPFQERLLRSERMAGNRAVHPIPVRIRFTGPLDVPALRAALARLVERHEALRTGFETIDGRVHQIVADPPGLPIPLRDMDIGGADGFFVREPFDPGAIPQARAALAALGPDEHELLLTVHHTVCDGSSIEQLLAELVEDYRGGEVPRPRMGLLDWTERRLTTAGSDGSTVSTVSTMEYWLDHLDGVPPILELPIDHPRTNEVDTAAIRFTVDEGLRSLARTERAGLAAVMLSGLAVVLNAYTRQDDFCVGIPVSLRDDPALDRTVGPLLNTVALRLRVDRGMTFRTLVRETASAVREAQLHSAIPFERVMEALTLPRETGVTPLFQVMFTHERIQRRRWRVGDLQVTADVAGTTAARNDLTFAVAETADRIEVILEYRTDIFDSGRMTRMAGHCRTLFSAAAADPGLPVGRLPLLTPGEHAQFMAWNDTGAVITDTTAAQLFAGQAARNPGAPAIYADGSVISYGELDAAAGRLARHLAGIGAGPETVVGVGLPRSPDAIVALLGVHKAGAAYLPLDPGYPSARLAAIVQDVRCRLVVTRPGLLPDLPVREVHIGAHPPGEAELVPAKPHGLAYVIHTSGSTGVPNGVAVTHRSLVARTHKASYVEFGPGQAVLSLASLSFDASISEIWGPLLNGGAIVIPRSDQPFLDQVREGARIGAVTTVQFVSPQLPLVMDSAGDLLDGITQVMVGGDLMSPRHAAKLLAERAVRFVHVYGPTECTLFALTDVLTQVDPDKPTVPLGRPLPNTRLYLLDEDLRPVPVGVSGEIVLAGAGLARGYLHQPGLTARRFRPDPFGPPGSRMYRTGDLGRMAPDGRVEFLGRLDHQVKIRGYRVDPGEVESVLRAHPAVADAVAMVVRDGLAAYVVPADPVAPPGTETLRDHCRSRLPAHSVPGLFAVVDRFPLTRNGKIDRDALPAITPAAPGPAAIARTPVEQALAKLWARVLEVPDVSMDTDFFVSGGDSLKIIKLFDLVESAWPGRLRLAELFVLGTVRAQAAAITEREAT
jgi:amino acid adenylation domain-containing protein